MGLIKLLPRSLSMALFYMRAKKVAARNTLTNEEKIKKIHRLENSCIDDITEIIHGSSEQDVAIAIGLKDMSKIYLQLNEPDEALRYLSVVENVFPTFVKMKSDKESIFEGFLFSLFYRGRAYAMKGNVEQCAEQFDLLNKEVNERISKDPSNSRLVDVYVFFNSKFFNTMIEIPKDHPAKKQEAYNTCLRFLKIFETRDPGNEQLLDYIGRFH